MVQESVSVRSNPPCQTETDSHLINLQYKTALSILTAPLQINIKR
jgi:hypothetical protein